MLTLKSQGCWYPEPYSEKLKMSRTETLQRVELKDYINNSNLFYQDLLGYKPEQTSLQEISKSQWSEFVEKREFNSNSRGIYLPRNQTAIVQKREALSLFHEYFGHGLFLEQTVSGQKLVELERKLLDEEKQEFQRRQFSLENIQKFRKQNQTFKELNEFKEQNLAQYELFAIWTEYLLSRKFGLNQEFKIKYDFLQREEREVVDSAINFSERYGNLATFYSFGLKKIQDKKRLIKLTQDIFNKRLNKTSLILHFGSKKPFSDIDLFVISNDIPTSYDSWLDVRAYKLNEITLGINVLNPMITDPIMVGNLVFGEERYQEKLKRKILAQPITEEAINFNLQEYECERRRAKDKLLGDYLQNKNLRSAKTYLTNALALKNGDKILTFDGLVDYSKRKLSHNEKFIELKVGIE